MTERPNFLFIICDQLRADSLGCYGHPVVKTPNIDALAASGTMFSDFHVASPVCMPNRASLMTGRMPSQHGLRYNGCLLPKSANTFVDVLAADGYHTASIGKSHLQPFLDRPPIRQEAPQKGPIAEAWKNDGQDYTFEQPENYQTDGRFDFPTPYFGFQHVDMVTSHGDQCGGHYHQWFRENCPNWRAMHDPANELAHRYTCPQAYRTPIPEAYYPTTYVGNQGVNYLQSRAGNADPFFAFVSFPDPHHPFNPPGKYWDMYDPDDFDVTLPYDAHENPTPAMAFVSADYEAGIQPPTPQTVFRTKDKHIREAMALTAGMITLIDDQVGRLVQTLKETGQYDNTVIIFTSDHGDYLGDFNMMLKGAMLFRGVTNVPMIWSDPDARRGTQNHGLASTIDLSATILDRASSTPYFGMMGQSLVASMENNTPVRQSMLIEYNDTFAKVGFAEPARVRMVLRKDFAFKCFLDASWGEMYDLAADPKETKNLWDDPAYTAIKCELAQELNHHLIRQMDESPQSTRLA